MLLSGLSVHLSLKIDKMLEICLHLATNSKIIQPERIQNSKIFNYQDIQKSKYALIADKKSNPLTLN